MKKYICVPTTSKALLKHAKEMAVKCAVDLFKEHNEDVDKFTVGKVVVIKQPDDRVIVFRVPINIPRQVVQEISTMEKSMVEYKYDININH